jgi:hypothetical protein
MFVCQRAILRFLILLTSVCMICAVVAQSALAEMSLRPKMRLEQEYTDNYFRSEDNEADIWVTSVNPGMEFKYFTDRSNVALDYVFSYFWHNENEDDVDSSDLDYAGHNLNFFAAHRFLTRLTLGVTEEFIRTREPASTDRFNDIVNRNKYWRNRVEPYLQYDIAEKGEARLAYRNEQFNWEQTDPGQEDSSENRGILTLTYNLNATNHLDLQGMMWNRDYDGDLSDYDSYQGELTYRREFSSWLKGEAGAGYQKRDFDESGLDDMDEFIFHIMVDAATDVSKLNFAFERNIVDFTISNEYFTAYRADLNGEYIFIDVIRAYAGGYYQNSDYENSSREDDTYNGHVGVGYSFLDKMFEVGLEYDFTTRDSSESGLDYDENRVFLRIDFIYDTGLR